jgi:hypothetical protein
MRALAGIMWCLSIHLFNLGVHAVKSVDISEIISMLCKKSISCQHIGPKSNNYSMQNQTMCWGDR